MCLCYKLLIKTADQRPKLNQQGLCVGETHSVQDTQWSKPQELKRCKLMDFPGGLDGKASTCDTS